jgi:hypothetical protein
VSIKMTSYVKTFPEHEYGLPAHITRLTHQYGPGASDAWDMLGMDSWKGYAPPFHFSDDPSEFYWIIPKRAEVLELELNVDPKRFSEEEWEAARLFLEELELAATDGNDDEESSPPSPERFHEPSLSRYTSATVGAHIGRSERPWEPLSTAPDVQPSNSASNEPSNKPITKPRNEPVKKPSNRPGKKPARNPTRKHANHLRYGEESCVAGPSNARAGAQSPLPELVLSGSDDGTLSPPPRTPEKAHEHASRLGASAVGKGPLPGFTPLRIVEAATSSPLGDVDESDALVVAQPSSPEPAPPTSNSAATSRPPIWLKASGAERGRSGASAVVRSCVPKPTPLISHITAAGSLPTLPEEEEEGFETVTQRHNTNANPDAVTKSHVEAYQSEQKVFQSALFGLAMPDQDRGEYDGLFKRGPDGSLVKMQAHQIKRAAAIARGSPAWIPGVSHKVMHALWKTIFHREAAGAWYARMHAKDKRVESDAGHKLFIVALKAAWSILNDGTVYNPGSPPTARPGAA